MPDRLNGIVAYFYCKKCQEEMPSVTSTKDWSRLSVGWTKAGIQVWCDRHDCDIMSLDFPKMTRAAR
jgi:hypothetical protein